MGGASRRRFFAILEKLQGGVQPPAPRRARVKTIKVALDAQMSFPMHVAIAALGGECDESVTSQGCN